jgi:hypothetical protein
MVALADFLSSLRISEYFMDRPHGMVVNIPVDHDKVEAEGLDVPDEGRVAVYKHRFTEINGFKEGIAEAFEEAREGDKIRVGVHVPKGKVYGVDFLVVPGTPDGARYESQVHALIFCALLKPAGIFEPLVPRFVGYQ